MRSLQESVGQLAEENSELKRKIERFEHRPLRGPSQSKLQVSNTKLCFSHPRRLFVINPLECMGTSPKSGWT